LDQLSLIVAKNDNDHVVSCNGCDYPANIVWFHPGPSEQSVVRWTAPGDMRIALVAHFLALDTGSSIVRVYLNGTEVFSSTLGDIGAAADYALTTTCHAGDIIDIAVDAITYFNDSVQLDVVIAPPIGACCFPSGSCLQGTQEDCEAAGGDYVGDGVPCDPNPCDLIPAGEATWGELKSTYR
jgi:hypothetical protein